VTSGAASGKYAYWGAYAASKAGLEALVKSWAAELVNTQLRANLINPGATRTQMRAKAFPGEDPESLPPPEALVPLFLEIASPRCERNGEIVNFRAWRAAHRPDMTFDSNVIDADV
jgi:NAD(P)-dependent dehydrogenase (short-subunit alcohol dehydrogenase family)